MVASNLVLYFHLLVFDIATYERIVKEKEMKFLFLYITVNFIIIKGTFF